MEGLRVNGEKMKPDSTRLSFAGISACSYGTIRDCHVVIKPEETKETYTESDAMFYQTMGGIVGSAVRGRIERCTSEVIMVGTSNITGGAAKMKFMGGIAGISMGATLKDCVLKSGSRIYAANQGDYIGGLIGGMPTGGGVSEELETMVDCRTEEGAEIYSQNSSAGGLIGQTSGQFIRCSNGADVTVISGNAGGIGGVYAVQPT